MSEKKVFVSVKLLEAFKPIVKFFCYFLEEVVPYIGYIRVCAAPEDMVF